MSIIILNSNKKSALQQTICRGDSLAKVLAHTWRSVALDNVYYTYCPLGEAVTLIT
jgi:hypothetical protein